MTKQELAEAVAKGLGWTRICNTYTGVTWSCYSYPHNGAGTVILTDDQLPMKIFSWPVTGLMIEDMEREGWTQQILAGRMRFIKYSHAVTSDYLIGEGYHKAIAKAYLEAKEIIRNANG